MNASCLLLTGVFDGPLPGGTPKGIELSATCAIPDLSRYGLGSANNGGGSAGVEYNFGAGSLSAGAFVYVSSEAEHFEKFFGFAPSATSGAANVNGDDAIELFLDGAVVDTFGEISADGTNRPWEYLDGWAYRSSGTGPDGATFRRASWTFGGINALDTAATNAAAASPMPIGQYSQPSPPALDATVILGPSGNGCPVGYSKLNTIAECRAGMEMLGLAEGRGDYGLEGTETHASWPAGCYYCRNVDDCTDGIWLNYHQTGSAYGDAKPLCGMNFVPLAQGELLLVGDSDIDYWRSTYSTFPRSHNIGVGGSTCKEVRDEADAMLAAFAPSLVICVCGENDLAAGKSVSATMALLRSAVEKMVAAGARVLFIGTKPERDSQALWPQYVGFDAAVCEYAASLAASATAAGLPPPLVFIDSYGGFNDLSNPISLYASDGLHLSGEGYAQWESWTQIALSADAGCFEWRSGLCVRSSLPSPPPPLPSPPLSITTPTLSPSPSPPPSITAPTLSPSPSSSASCPPRAELRQQLVGHTSFPYTSSRTDTWDVLKEADADPAAAANVWLVYADRSTNGAQEYNSGAGWTREHLWPQSLARYEASSNDEPATDLHALRAALQSCNSHRSNHVFGAVLHTDWVPSHIDCPLLMCAGESGVCEPHDSIKGEIARALMYMALRYDGLDDVSASSGPENWLDLRLADVSNGGEALLASWSDTHAPGAAEITRDAVIASRQGFGNPFVADPTLTRCRYEQGSLQAMPPSPLPPSSVPSSASTIAKTAFTTPLFSAAAIAFTAASTLWRFPR